jgi:hypothetical protein
MSLRQAAMGRGIFFEAAMKGKKLPDKHKKALLLGNKRPMKLTDAHISNETLNSMISWSTIYNGDDPADRERKYQLLNALLELKQRRAEDRANAASTGETWK